MTVPRFDFNAALMARDMVLLGWNETQLARAAEVSAMTVGRFFSGQHRTPQTARKLAAALNQPLERYLVESAEGAA